MITSEQLESCKRYMRVDDQTEDELIRALMEAAVIYLRDAGVDEHLATKALYDVALWSLTLYYYDHRDDVSAGAAGLPAGLRPIISQLKISCQLRAAVEAAGLPLT